VYAYTTNKPADVDIPSPAALAYRGELYLASFSRGPYSEASPVPNFLDLVATLRAPHLVQRPMWDRKTDEHVSGFDVIRLLPYILCCSELVVLGTDAPDPCGLPHVVRHTPPLVVAWHAIWPQYAPSEVQGGATYLLRARTLSGISASVSGPCPPIVRNYD
jgi:hypothetical protein